MTIRAETPQHHPLSSLVILRGNIPNRLKSSLINNARSREIYDDCLVIIGHIKRLPKTEIDPKNKGRKCHKQEPLSQSRIGRRHHAII
jgi:hypothetical protein